MGRRDMVMYKEKGISVTILKLLNNTVDQLNQTVEGRNEEPMQKHYHLFENWASK